MTQCKTAIQRQPCILCALKHVAQARALMLETRKGYQRHIVYAMGHLAEAEDETVMEFPEIAKKVRHERVLLEATARLPPEEVYQIDFDALTDWIIEFDEAHAEKTLKEIQNGND